MTKGNSLFMYATKSAGYLLALPASLAATIFIFDCLEARQFPYVPTPDNIAEYSILGTWIAGITGMLWIFLMVMEILKRRNFDLETLNDTSGTEPLPLWILKQAITKVATALILLGSTLIFIPTGFLSLQAYLDIFRSYWVVIIAALAIVFAVNILGEIIERQWRKFKAR